MDLRTVTFNVPPQEILTKDSVTVAVDAVVYYKIREPLAAVCNVADYAKSTKLLASTTLRTILGTKNLAEILSDREFIAKDILAHLDGATDPWGIQVRWLKIRRIAVQSEILITHSAHHHQIVVLISFNPTYMFKLRNY